MAVFRQTTRDHPPGRPRNRAAIFERIGKKRLRPEAATADIKLTQLWVTHSRGERSTVWWVTRTNRVNGLLRGWWGHRLSLRWRWWPSGGQVSTGWRRLVVRRASIRPTSAAVRA